LKKERRDSPPSFFSGSFPKSSFSSSSFCMWIPTPRTSSGGTFSWS
jgi:hypothetical protein